MITIQRNGQHLGPYDNGQIKRLIEDGLLHGSDLAWRAESQEWRPLASIPIFSSLFSAKERRSLPITATLRTLCVVTILGSIFGIIRGCFYQEIATMGNLHDSYWRGLAYVIFSIGTLVGAIMMLNRSIAGLYVYLVCQSLYLVLVLYTIILYLPYAGTFALTIGTLFILPSLALFIFFLFPETRRSLR